MRFVCTKGIKLFFGGFFYPQCLFLLKFAVTQCSNLWLSLATFGWLKSSDCTNQLEGPLPVLGCGVVQHQMVYVACQPGGGGVWGP